VVRAPAATVSAATPGSSYQAHREAIGNLSRLGYRLAHFGSSFSHDLDQVPASRIDVMHGSIYARRRSLSTTHRAAAWIGVNEILPLPSFVYKSAFWTVMKGLYRIESLQCLRQRPQTGYRQPPTT
jgi:hypothetical protein